MKNITTSASASPPTSLPPAAHGTLMALLASPRRAVLLLIFLWAAAYLPFLGSRFLRLEEGRRAEPARAMLVSHDYVVPRLYGEVYLNKPPLFFWLTAGMARWTGSSELAVRIPSVLAVLLGALALLKFAPQSLSFPARALAALMALASPTLLDKGTLGEMDALLTTLVLVALGLWWNDEEKRQAQGDTRLTTWLLIGLILALTTLLKGPGGLAEFYIPLGLYLLIQKRPWRLVSLGHLLCVLIYLLPTLFWVGLVLHQTGRNIHDMLTLWTQQLGADPAPAVRTAFDLARYIRFPLSLMGMLAPWCFFALPMLIPSKQPANSRPMGRFLSLWLIATSLLFWLYPSSHPRHMMAVIWPVCLLAAMNLSCPPENLLADLLKGLMRLIQAVPLLVSLGVSIAAWKFGCRQPAALALSLAASILLSVVLGRWETKRSQAGQRGYAWPALAASLALVILAGRSTAAVWFLPWKAPSDPPALYAQACREWLSAERPRYTTRHFGPLGDNFYNVQFYLGPNLQALRDLETLPTVASLDLIATPEETRRLEGLYAGRRRIYKLATLAPPGGPAPVNLLRIDVIGSM